MKRKLAAEAVQYLKAVDTGASAGTMSSGNVVSADAKRTPHRSRLGQEGTRSGDEGGSA